MRRLVPYVLLFVTLLSASALANFQVTQGSGTTFLSSTDVSGFHAPTNTIGDATNPDQKACVDSSGNVCTVDKNGSTIATNTGNTSTGVGGVGDGAWSGSGNGSIIAVLKAVYTKLAGVLTTSDAADASTGSAVPSKGIYVGVQNSSGMTGLISCDSTAFYDASTSGSTQLVALSSGKTIYICGQTIMASGTVNVELDYGTGAACVTSPTKITPAWQLTAQTGVNDNATFWSGLKTAASNELCIKTSAGVAVQALIHYTQF